MANNKDKVRQTSNVVNDGPRLIEWVVQSIKLCHLQEAGIVHQLQL